MDELELNQLADQVVAIMDEREGLTRNDALSTVGAIALFAGAGYVGMRVLRTAVDAHRFRKMNKAKK